MIFKDAKPDFYQSHSVILGCSMRQMANDFLQRRGYAAFKDVSAAYLAEVQRVPARLLLVKSGFVPSGKEFDRAVSQGSIRYCGERMPRDFFINAGIPDPNHEFRRGTRFLEVVVPTPSPLIEYGIFRARQFFGRQAYPIIKLGGAA